MPICSVSSWTAAATLNYFELINYIELALQCLIRFLLPNCMNYCNLYLEYISRIQLTVYYEGILFNSGQQKSHHFVVIKSIQIKHSDVAVMICCSPSISYLHWLKVSALGIRWSKFWERHTIGRLRHMICSFSRSS